MEKPNTSSNYDCLLYLCMGVYAFRILYYAREMCPLTSSVIPPLLLTITFFSNRVPPKSTGDINLLN